MQYLTRSEADTMAFAARLSGMLAPGDTVLLRGDLGAGKSVLARGIALDAQPHVHADDPLCGRAGAQAVPF